MSDRPTPLTDSLATRLGYSWGTDQKSLLDFARQLERDRAELIEALRDLLGFCQRRLPTGSIPPQGQRAIDLLAHLTTKDTER